MRLGSPCPPGCRACDAVALQHHHAAQQQAQRPAQAILEALAAYWQAKRALAREETQR
jgi:hypothetical protein